ncbi:hypothetical protein [Specibacter sp. NPDC078709]|uniref:hypothetical protein n=1 Tax=Specibacter sp. NPDC078709 TaxID=3154364 RepID=UPI00341C0A79
MSTPNELPGPEQQGSQPPPSGYGSQPNPTPPVTPTPPTGQGYQGGPAQPPPGYQQPGTPPHQPPPGYQQPGAPQYQPPGAPSGDFKFEMPQDMPHSVREVMPVGGFAGIFKMDGLPQMLKLSYIMWLAAAGIWVLTTLVLLLGSLFALGAGNDPFGFGAAVRAAGVKGIIVSLISFVLIAAIVICAMKLKEGMQWARMALSAIAFLTIVLMFFGGGGGLLAVVATVLMWLPESTAWLNSRSGNALH